MNVPVATSDDLVDLYGRYIAMVESGRADSLELDFAPGVYGVAKIGPISLDLGGNPAPRDPKIDVVLRGRAPDQPAVLRDMGVLVNARSLHLENLVITGRMQRVLECRVARTFTMRGCVIARNTWGGPWDGVLAMIGGVAGQDAFVARIEDSWVVDNDEQSRSAVLAIRGATGSYVERVELVRVGLVENRNACDVAIDEAREIQLEDVLAVKEQGSALLAPGRADRVEATRCTFALATRAMLPPAIALRDSAVHDRAELAPRAALDDALAALGHGAAPFAAARGRIAAALGLRC
jgi:hypothetical protein